MSRALVLLGGQRPHELLLLVLSVITGVTNLIAPPPGSPMTALPDPMRISWAFGMILSGLAGLLGCLWRWNAERGLLIEQGAMLLGAGMLLILWAAITALIDWRRGLLSAGTILFWMVANLWRAAQIRADLRRLRQLRRGDQP